MLKILFTPRSTEQQALSLSLSLCFFFFFFFFFFFERKLFDLAAVVNTLARHEGQTLSADYRHANDLLNLSRVSPFA